MNNENEIFDIDDEITIDIPKKNRKTKKRTSNNSYSKVHKKKRKSKRKKKKKNMLYVHVCIIGVILLIALLGTVKLVNWNKGKQSDYDPSEINTEFDMETEDYLLPLTKDMANLRTQDDILTVLILGNDMLAKNNDDVTVASCLEKISGANVIDASIDRTFLSTKNETYSEDYPGDIFSLYWISYCIAENNFELMENTAGRFEGDARIREKIDMLKNLDMSTVDVISIMYDFHDFEDKRLLTTPYDTFIPGSCCGSLFQSITLLKKAFPHIRIIVSSPYYCYVKDENGAHVPCETLDFGNGTLADYMVAFKNIAVDTGVCFIDHYIGTINADNYTKYLDKKHRYPNSKGKLAIAQRINDFLA